MAPNEVSFSEARERLAELWDQVIANREPIRLTRRGSDPVVLMAADDYEGLRETAHLLRSPANAARLLAALDAPAPEAAIRQPCPPYALVLIAQMSRRGRSGSIVKPGSDDGEGFAVFQVVHCLRTRVLPRMADQI